MTSHSKIYIHTSIVSGSYTLFVDSAKEYLDKLAKNKEVVFLLYGPGYWSSKLLDEYIIPYCKTKNISAMVVGNTSSVLLSSVDHFCLLMDSYEHLVYPYQKYIKYSNDEQLRIIKLEEKKNAI